jgi:hypothetical protein
MPIKNVQSSVPFVISDIDNTVSLPEKEDNDISSTSTITFTPVSSENSSQPKIVVTTNTRQIDLTGELESISSTSNSYEDNRVLLENNDFDDFSPENEFKDSNQSKKFIRRFSILKRRSFLTSTFSVFFTLLLCVMKLPFMSGLVLGKTVASMIVCTSITFLVLLLNIDMFLSLAKAFSKKAGPDVLAAIASIFVLFELSFLAYYPLLSDMLSHRLFIGFQIQIRIVSGVTGKNTVHCLHNMVRIPL